MSNEKLTDTQLGITIFTYFATNFMDAFVFMKIWNWFISGYYGVKYHVGYSEGLIICFAFSLLKLLLFPDRSASANEVKDFSKTISSAYVRPVVVLIFAYVAVMILDPIIN